MHRPVHVPVVFDKKRANPEEESRFNKWVEFKQDRGYGPLVIFGFEHIEEF